jgi:hypothetical protein
MDNIKSLFNRYIFGAAVVNPSTLWYVWNWTKADTERVYEWSRKAKEHLLTGYVPIIILLVLWLRYLYNTIQARRKDKTKLDSKVDTKVTDTTNNMPTANNHVQFFSHPGWIATNSGNKIMSNAQVQPVTQPQQQYFAPQVQNPTEHTTPYSALNHPRGPMQPTSQSIDSRRPDEQVNERLTSVLESINKLIKQQANINASQTVLPPFQPYIGPTAPAATPVNVFNTLHVAPPALFTKKTKVAGWIDKMETFMAVNNITQNKKETMWSYIDEDCIEILSKVTFDKNPDIAYAELKQNLKDLFGVEEANFLTNVANFTRRDQMPGESIKMYGLALDSMARKAFGELHKDLDCTIMDRFLAGLRDPDIRTKFIINRPINSTKLIESAALLEKTLNNEKKNNSSTANFSNPGSSADQNKTYSNNGLPEYNQQPNYPNRSNYNDQQQQYNNNRPRYNNAQNTSNQQQNYQHQSNNTAPSPTRQQNQPPSTSNKI